MVEAYRILAHHYASTLPGSSSDPLDRDVRDHPYDGVGEHSTVGELLESATNPTRSRPFAIRPVLAALVDADAPSIERWPDAVGADGVVVWEARLGGHAATVVGIESHHRHPDDRLGPHSGTPLEVDAPRWWASGTFYPQSAKKLSRALNAASGRRPAVVLANLAGFDGSRWSLRHQQLEFGAELARAVVNFEGTVVVVVIGRFHGGAYVVLNRRLNPGLRIVALEGSRVSVIGGQVAAEVVLRADVRRRVELLVEAGADRDAALWEARRTVATEFDELHSVDRALEHGSVDLVIPPARLRPAVIELLEGAGDA
jgi:acetyl-CoA carboxylase carboxyltransferase component